MELAAKTIKELVATNQAAQTTFDVLSPIGTVYVVGGAVRDIFLGKEPKDIDMLVTEIPLETIKDSLKKAGGKVTFTGIEKAHEEEKEGKAFGVLHYSIGGDHVEIALPRVEHSTGVGHRDFEVEYDHRIPVEVDLGRRDFTANAMALNLNMVETSPGQALIDPYGGIQDIANNTLRLVNQNAFQEDPLRIVRAIVSYARHGLIPDEETEEAMKANADKIRNLPGERIQMELDKLLAAPDPAIAFEIAAESGVLDYIMPEVSQTVGFDQNNKYHDLELGEHLFNVLRNISATTDDIDLRLAAILHDIGKPDSYWEDEEGHAHYYENEKGEGRDHEELGAEMAEELMERLAYPRDRIDRVTNLIKHHMFPYFTTMRGARKHLNALNGDHDVAQDLMKLRDADSRGKNKEIRPEDQTNIELGNRLLEEVKDSEHAVTVKQLDINGNDLISMGLEQGPRIGEILNELLHIVIDNPSLNNKDDLIQLARNMI